MRHSIAILRNWLTGQTSDGTSCADSLKGGITRKLRHQGNPAEKWLAYSTPKSERLGKGIAGQGVKTGMLVKMTITRSLR
jgi:hypothetical protein